MNLSRTLFRAVLGNRLPVTSGVRKIRGPEHDIRIGRDKNGIPYIEAKSDRDAWFGQGFCQGQDRCFQLELLARVARGTLAELIGPDGLPVDRLSRRIGFRRHGLKQLQALDPDIREMLESFAAGVTAGKRRGGRRPPHELAILMRKPTPFEPADTLGILGVMCFLLASNWDSELARLDVLDLDGPDALAAVDRPYPEWLATAQTSGKASGLDPLARAAIEDARELAKLLGIGGGSNNWVLSPAKAKNGRAILANDPHLAPLAPPQWYLSRVSAPGWKLAGAAFVGSPGVSSGHNGHAAWGVTAGMVDNTDLFLEELGPGGTTVREGDRFVPTEIIHERIRVRGPWGHRILEEDVVVTKRGPVLTPALPTANRTRSLSFAATWLQGLPLRGILDLKGVRSFEDFRKAMSSWPSLTLNFVYADADGHIGWQLTGLPPIRKGPNSGVPVPGWDSRLGWQGIADPRDLPCLLDPPTGFIATANAKPTSEPKIDLGFDWLDGYRMERIQRQLASRDDWDLVETRKLQLDQRSLVWDEIRAIVLDALTGVPDSGEKELLVQWDGVVSKESAGATLFELCMHELMERAIQAKAPRSAGLLLGSEIVRGLADSPMYSFRRQGWIVRLLRERPQGWFEHGWSEEIARAFMAACQRLRVLHGPEPTQWAWGELRGLELLHPMGQIPVFRKVFNLGPFSWGGDTNTVAQATNGTLNPLSNPCAVANLRTSIEAGNWDEARFVLAGGQSGNPCSPHYSDLLELWKLGEGVPIAWSEEKTRAALVSELILRPVP